MLNLQDTNTTQYELMKCFAQVYGGVSVVGDPDQSIYGWRAAEVENLNKMADGMSQSSHMNGAFLIDRLSWRPSYLPGGELSFDWIDSCSRALYSIARLVTGSLLGLCSTLDRERIQKSLYTSHPKSTPVCLKTFSTPVIEASFIATEIKRLVAYSGNVLNYGDFAILRELSLILRPSVVTLTIAVRYNALSRVIESALQKDQIPNRIVGGHKFFERMEIKDLLAYLQLADNPGFSVRRTSYLLVSPDNQPAFIRVVNVPRRAIGDKVNILPSLPDHGSCSVCGGFTFSSKGSENIADGVV